MADLHEGQFCPACSKGRLQYERQDPCSCHINPPCSACVDAPLTCDECGEFDFEACKGCGGTGERRILRNASGNVDFIGGMPTDEFAVCNDCGGSGYR